MPQSTSESVQQPTPSPPMVTVIIPVRNDAERLRLCLEALENQTYPSHLYEIIVVDNASTSPLEPVVSPFTQAIYAYESRQGSYAARNRGIALARGAVLAFTDADCIPAADWIEQGIMQLLRQPGIGLVGGRIQVFMQNPSNPTALELYDYVLAFPQHEYIDLYHYGATANVFTFPEVFEHVGVFNETLLSGGDREWGQRVAAASYPLIYAHNVIVQHPARRSLIQFLRKLTRTAIGMGNITSMQTISETTGAVRTQKLPMYNIRKSLRTLVRAATTERLQRADQRLHVIFIMLLREICWISVFSYVRIVKRIKQTLSAHSQRYSQR